MSLFDYLLQHRTPQELAKEPAQQARENAALKDRVDALEHELFWMKVRESDDVRALRLENQKLRDEKADMQWRLILKST